MFSGRMEEASTGRLQTAAKLSYGVGHVFNDLIGTMWFTYILVYLQFVMKVPASTAGAILMVGQLVEAITTPLSGMESDRMTGFGNYGRRKSTHLFGTFLTLISFPFIFVQLPGFDKSSPEALLVYYIPLVFIFKVGWATVHVGHLSLIPELSSDHNDRDDLAILRYIFDSSSDISVYFVTWAALIARSSSNSITIDDSDGWRFRNIALILVAIGLIFNTIFHVFTVEKQSKSAAILDENAVHFQTTKTSVAMKWNDWFREKHYFQVGILVVLARLFLNLTQAFLPLFLQEGIRAPQEYIAIAPGVCQLASLMGSLLVKVVLYYSTKKVAFVMGTCLSFTGCIWLSFDSPEAVRSGNIFPLASCIGAGTGMITIIATSFVSDLIADNTESSAYVFGSIAFIHNLLNGLIVFLVQIGHGFCETCPTYYRNVIAHGLSSIAIVSLAIVLFLDPEMLGKRLSGKNTLKGRENNAKDNNQCGKKYGSILEESSES